MLGDFQYVFSLSICKMILTRKHSESTAKGENLMLQQQIYHKPCILDQIGVITWQNVLWSCPVFYFIFSPHSLHYLQQKIAMLLVLQ